jgi:hypothetical protein
MIIVARKISHNHEIKGTNRQSCLQYARNCRENHQDVL